MSTTAVLEPVTTIKTYLRPIDGTGLAAFATKGKANPASRGTNKVHTVMEGQYRGPVYGNATVEWLRDGPHYQVRVEVSIPPLGGRRMLSDGQLGPGGLSPRRYDEETEVALRATQRQTVLFEPDRIQLANGKVNDPLPGVQDSASQFVQLTWLFLTQPELRKMLDNGTMFPDGGYPLGDPYAEIAHWEPFQGAYLDWIVGRRISDRDRTPAYNRIKAIFIERIQQDTGKRIYMPAPAWST